MALHFFKKELLNKVIIGPGGIPVYFDPIPGNTGILKLDDENPEQADLAKRLNEIAGSRGVVKLSESGFEELKKKRSSASFVSRLSASVPPIRVLNPPVLPKSKPPVPPAVPAVTSEPAPVVAPVEPAADSIAPKPAFKPRLGRPPVVKAPKSVSMAPVHQEVVKMS